MLLNFDDRAKLGLYNVVYGRMIKHTLFAICSLIVLNKTICLFLKAILATFSNKFFYSVCVTYYNVPYNYNDFA
jgi:hypothetical protein